MPPDVQTLRPYLQNCDLTGLLVDGLGWNHYHGPTISVPTGGDAYALHPVAEKAGFAVYRCDPNPDGAIPPYSVRRQIESKVAETNYEHLIIFTDFGQTVQVWQWVKRESGKPPAFRELRYDQGQTGTALLQRLHGIAFTLDEEGSLGITDVTGRFRDSLDVERVTRRFYDRFRAELSAFQQFINGFTSQGDRDWYASLMLNRMMFVYFIQKQGFLDGDEHYLRNRLQQVQEQDGPDRFQRFYRRFLLRLFHEGLGQPEAQRSPELTALLGQVPYLNGGIFDPHALEQDNPDINIPDAAFAQIFAFFDQYQWHLDDRPTGADNEINPDVLGYIFEKYVNQKQMGAYYTKEDITGYIARSAVIPRLLEMARRECPVAFAPDAGVWRLLRDDPDHYIYPSVGHGVAWDYSPDAITRLDEPLELPADIAAGLNDPAQRSGWNQPAPAEYALPTETWRELIARRQRYEAVRDQLAAGQVQSVNDLITLNLDSERFARDVIIHSEGPELIRALWNALAKISILDPACGSGAFLFAALNILEPLYSAVIQAMRHFIADLATSQRPRPPQALQDFRKILQDAGQRRSERYYILKSIIVNNLYGVDIMAEAVEICRLRLFLKLAAQLEYYDQIEPLPDIDFNIQAGNSLVGFTTAAAVRSAITADLNGQQRMITPDDEAALQSIEANAANVARQFHYFQQIQTEYGMGHAQLSAQSKQSLQSQLNDLRLELHALLAKEYGIDAAQPADFHQWQATHQPFHWFTEFHSIMRQGGFDVVIGNPPYLEYSKVRKEYRAKGLVTERCGNLYAMFIERSYSCLRRGGRFGMIVQLSYSCTDRMEPVQQLCLSQSGSLWLSHFDDRPAKLFDGLEHIRATIVISARSDNGADVAHATAYNRWYTEARQHLFDTIALAPLVKAHNVPGGTLPKIGPMPASAILERIAEQTPLGSSLAPSGKGKAYFHNAPQYWVRAMDFAPYFWNERDGEQISSHVKTLNFPGAEDAAVAVAALNSSLFYWWFLLLSNCRDLTLREIERFPIGLAGMKKAAKRQLAQLTDELMESFRRHSQRKETRYQTTGRVIYDEFDQKPSKPIIDQIDRVLAEHYGFTDEELDFIINYDIKYRMGRS